MCVEVEREKVTSVTNESLSKAPRPADGMIMKCD